MPPIILYRRDANGKEDIGRDCATDVPESWWRTASVAGDEGPRTGYVRSYGRAAEVAHIPSGHPEGFYEAFSNIYDSFTSTIAKKKAGEELTASDLDFPTCVDGMLGVKYLHAVIDSGKNDSAWREVK